MNESPVHRVIGLLAADAPRKIMTGCEVVARVTSSHGWTDF